MKIFKNLALAAVVVALLSILPASAVDEANHEVWMISRRPDQLCAVTLTESRLLRIE